MHPQQELGRLERHFVLNWQLNLQRLSIYGCNPATSARAAPTLCLRRKLFRAAGSQGFCALDPYAKNCGCRICRFECKVRTGRTVVKAVANDSGQPTDPERLVRLVHMRGALPTLPQAETACARHAGEPPSITILRHRPIALPQNTTKKRGSQRQSGIGNEYWSTRIKLSSLQREPTTTLDRSKGV